MTNADPLAPAEQYLEPSPDVALFYRRWTPRPENDHGRTLLIVHGACEHSGRFSSLGSKAAAEGWQVIAPDLRGHGRSTGLVVHVEDFHDYLTDLKAVVEAHQLQPENTAVLGCSMGGLVTIRFQQWWFREFNSPASRVFYMIAPLLGIRHPIERWKKLAARLLGRHRPQTTFRSTIDPDQLTHDEEVTRNRGGDPCMRHHVTARWYLESTQAMREAWDQVDALNLPTRVFQGGGDTVVDPWAARAWADCVNRRHERDLVQFHCLPGWYHELLNELQGKEFEDLLLRLFAADMGVHEEKVNGAAVPELREQALSQEVSSESMESGSSAGEVKTG